MNLNRRTTLIGLGTIVAGGGAALGSGAFSQVQAERGLEVNVVTGEDISEEFVDVLINPELDEEEITSIGIREEDDSRNDNFETLFPTDASGQYGQEIEFGDSAISLVDNDVTIVFGASEAGGDFDDLDGIPANSRVEYEDLFEIVNDNGEDATDFDVTFELTGREDGDEPNYDLDFEDPEMDETTVEAGQSETVGTTILETGGDNDEIGELTITIE